MLNRSRILFVLGLLFGVKKAYAAIWRSKPLLCMYKLLTNSIVLELKAQSSVVFWIRISAQASLIMLSVLACSFSFLPRKTVKSIPVFFTSGISTCLIDFCFVDITIGFK